MKLGIFISLFILSSCAVSYQRQRIGLIKSEQLSEISGMVPSAYHTGLYWVHNDGGNPPLLYLIDTLGSIHAKVQIANAQNIDWEDIAQGTVNGTSFLYIGDIGDNKKHRETVQVYKVKEPVENQGEITVSSEMMNLAYSDGARDAEALMYDNQTNELILITKRELKARVYSFPFIEGTQTVAPKGTINHHWITGADISNTGDIILKNYGHVYYWPSTSNTGAFKLLTQTTSEKLKYRREPLGEAICWYGQGGFITISERFGRKSVKIYRYLPDLKSK